MWLQGVFTRLRSAGDLGVEPLPWHRATATSTTLAAPAVVEVVVGVGLGGEVGRRASMSLVTWAVVEVVVGG